MKKAVKQWFAVVLTAILLMALSACRPVEDDIVDSPVTSMEQMESAVAQGNFEGAYRYLLSVKDDPEAVQWLTHFEYVPHIVHGGFNADEAYHYDNEGHWTSISGFSHSFDYAYDEHNRVISQTYMFGGSVCSSVQYTYDEQGRLSRESGTDVYSSQVDVQYLYDENGRLSNVVNRGTDNRLVYVYDEEGKCIRKERIYQEECIGVYLYEYDEYERLIQSTYENADGETTVTHYTYGANGRRAASMLRCDEYGNVIETDGSTCEWRIMYFPDGMSDNLRERIDEIQTGDLLILPNVIV